MFPTEQIRERSRPVDDESIRVAPSAGDDDDAPWVGYSLSENRSLGKQLPGSRNDGAVALLALVVGAGVAAFFGGSPTGNVSIDVAYVSLFGAFVATGAYYAGRIARVGALLPCVLLPGWFILPFLLLLPVLLYAAAATGPPAKQTRPSIRRGSSLVVGVVLVASYLHLGDDIAGLTFPRLSAIAAGLASGLLVVSAIRNTTGRVRGLFEKAAMTVAFVLALGVVNLAAVLYQAKPDLEQAASAIERGLGATDVRAIDGASVEIIEARRHLATARRTIDSSWASAGRLVPVVAQNYAALLESLDAIERSAIAAGRTVEAADVGGLRSESGGIDVAALERAEASAREFREVLGESVAVFHAQRGPWLLPALVEQLNDGASRSSDAIAAIDEQLPRLTVLPKLLGADRPRRYLVLIANPSETRDLGGFAGGFAVVELIDGNIDLVQTGRTTELSASGPPEIDDVIPDRFRDYEPWTFGQNYTGTPDLTVAANTLREIFPAMGGSEIDGVIYLDPFALGALTSLSGPISVDTLGLELDAETLPQFLLVDQYALIDDRDLRTSVLDVVSAEVFEQLQFGGLPSFDEIIETMSPMVAQGRLRMVTFDGSESEVLGDLGLTERFRPESFDDFLSVMHANGGPNKLDPYLHRTVSYDVTTQRPNAEAEAVLRIALENRAPDGLPDYVTSNRWNLDRATNRLLLIVHSPLDVIVASVDGNLVTVDSYYEFGLWRHELFVAVPRTQTIGVELELAGRFGVGMVDSDPSTHDLWVHHQPTVTNDSYTVSVDGTAKELLLTESARLRWPD